MQEWQRKKLEAEKASAEAAKPKDPKPEGEAEKANEPTGDEKPPEVA